MNTVMMWQTLSTSSAETEDLGEDLGRLLKGGEAIELCADLGGGKTTFVKGLVRGTGSTHAVASPSFTLNKIYPAKNGLAVHHYDFYRLGNNPGVVADQLNESLNDPRAITVAEWSGGVQNILPTDRLSIKFQPVAGKPDERVITFEYPKSKTYLINKLETSQIRVKP